MLTMSPPNRKRVNWRTCRRLRRTAKQLRIAVIATDMTVTKLVLESIKSDGNLYKHTSSEECLELSEFHHRPKKNPTPVGHGIKDTIVEMDQGGSNMLPAGDAEATRPV